jgi:hypothetical protein
MEGKSGGVQTSFWKLVVPLTGDGFRLFLPSSKLESKLDRALSLFAKQCIPQGICFEYSALRQIEDKPIRNWHCLENRWFLKGNKFRILYLLPYKCTV